MTIPISSPTTMSAITIEVPIQFHRQGPGGRRKLKSLAADHPPNSGPATATGPPHDSSHSSISKHPTGRLPRITRLLALAIHFDTLLRSGTITNYTDLSHLGQVSRARITQIMNLTLLAPDIQETILSLSRITTGEDPIHLRQLQSIALIHDWKKQRKLWERQQTRVTNTR